MNMMKTDFYLHATATQITQPAWGLFHEWFFHHNSNSMEISFCFHWSCSAVIAMKFCTWLNSCAVMTCAKVCSDMLPCNGVTLKPIFHRISITMEKSFMKWAPGPVKNTTTPKISPKSLKVSFFGNLEFKNKIHIWGRRQMKKHGNY